MKILFLSKGFIHPTLSCRMRIYDYIKEYFSKKNVEVARLPFNDIDKDILKSYDIVIIFFHIKTNDYELIDLLYDYVQGGGTLIGLHGIAASFKSSDRWYELIGGRFTSHPPIGNINIKYLDVNYLIKDELYRFDLGNIEIKMHSQVNGETEPCVWSKHLGKGTVYYFALGHSLKAIKSGTFKYLFFETLKLGEQSIDMIKQ